MINAVILLFISLLYIFQVQENSGKFPLHSVDFLYIIVGLELILTLPCLIYYIGERERGREREREGGRGKGGEREGEWGERESEREKERERERERERESIYFEAK